MNGAERTLDCEPRRTLLDALRGEPGRTGAKKACDMGNCGSCAVLLDDREDMSIRTCGAQCAEVDTKCRRSPSCPKS